LKGLRANKETGEACREPYNQQPTQATTEACISAGISQDTCRRTMNA
jgi:hypothetical protein